MQHWLLYGGDPRGLDFDDFLHQICGFKNVSFTFEGEKHTFNVQDIKDRIHSTKCKNCARFRAQLYLQQKPNVIDTRALIQKYIAENYVRTNKRCMKRNLLYAQIDLFLSRFELELTKELRKYIVGDILADESKQHRPFYLRRKYG